MHLDHPKDSTFYSLSKMIKEYQSTKPLCPMEQSHIWARITWARAWAFSMNSLLPRSRLSREISKVWTKSWSCGRSCNLEGHAKTYVGRIDLDGDGAAAWSCEISDQPQAVQRGMKASCWDNDLCRNGQHVGLQAGNLRNKEMSRDVRVSCLHPFPFIPWYPMPHWDIPSIGVPSNFLQTWTPSHAVLGGHQIWDLEAARQSCAKLSKGPLMHYIDGSDAVPRHYSVPVGSW